MITITSAPGKTHSKQHGEWLRLPTANQEAIGLVNVFGPDEGGKLVDGMLAVQEVTRKPGEIPKCLAREARPELVSYPAA